MSRFGFGVLVSGALMFALACGDQSPADDTTNGSSPGGPEATPTVMGTASLPPGVISVREAVEDESLVDQEVTIGGELGVAVAPHVAFLEGRLYSTEDLLVVAPRRSPGAFPTYAPVQATGTLAYFNVAEAERRMGVSLDEGILDRYDGELVLYAERLHFFLAGPSIRSVAIDLVGEHVTVTSVVDRLFGDDIFTVRGDESGPGGIVVIAPDASGVAPDSVVVAEGTVQLMSRDLLGRHGVTLDDGQYAELEGYPVLVAEQLDVEP